MDTLGGKQSMTAVNESGLYALVFKSRKPEAKAFRKWVTSEVLPVLRKTGRYAMPKAPVGYTYRRGLCGILAGLVVLTVDLIFFR